MRALVVVIGLLLAAPVLAQPVNAEILRKDRFDDGWSAEVNGSFALSSGNVNLLDLGAGLQLQYMALHERLPEDDAPRYIFQRFFIRGDARQADRAGDRFVNSGFTHARWTAMWLPRVGSELFAQLQFNEFLRLNTRSLTGAGMRVEIVHSKPIVLAFGSAYMFEFESIEVQDNALDEPLTLAHRWSNYLTGRVAILDGALLAQATVYVQPRFDDPQDLRILQDFDGTVVVTEHLSFGISLQVLFDSKPPTGVEQSDVRFATKVRLGF